MYGRILRCLAPLTGLMILVSAGWTAWNTVALLGTRNPVGYGVSFIFDSAWLVGTAVQHELRFRVDWRGRLAAVSWALAGLSAAVNASSELLGRHGAAVAAVAALVPLLAKGCLALKLLLEANSPDAKARFTALTQSWADQVTELRIGEAMAAQWHRVERLHENADAERLAVTQQDRLANLELTSGAELPVTRAAEPVVWERPPTLPLAPVFREPETPQTPAETPQESVSSPRQPFGFATTAHDVTDADTAHVVTTVHDGPADPRTAALMARNAERSAARAAAIARIRAEGLSVEDVVAVFGVTEQTARRWTREAQQ